MEFDSNCYKLFFSWNYCLKVQSLNMPYTNGIILLLMKGCAEYLLGKQIS